MDVPTKVKQSTKNESGTNELSERRGNMRMW